MNEDLNQINHPEGEKSINECRSECNLKPQCSAIEWFESGWDNSKCKLILTNTPASTGSTESRLEDASCHIKPINCKNH